MTREEECRLIERAQDGDREAQERLFRSHQDWIWKLVHRYDLGKDEKEDLFQAASVAWLQALQGFDVSRGTRLLTYVTPHLRKAMAEERENLTDVPLDAESVPLHTPPPGDEEGPTVAERTEDPRRADEDLYREDLAQGLEDALETLPARQSRILRLRHGLNGKDRPLTQEEVAEEIGVSQRWVSALEEKALLTLADRHSHLHDPLEDVNR